MKKILCYPKKPAHLHTFTPKSNIFDIKLPKQPVKQAQSWQIDDRGMQWVDFVILTAFLFLAKWTKLQLSLDCLCFKCTVLLLPAHLPENPTFCWDTKCPGSSYPLSSACIIICNPSKKSLKVLEKIKTRGRHAGAGDCWKFGSTGREPPAHEVWDKDMLLTGFYQ